MKLRMKAESHDHPCSPIKPPMLRVGQERIYKEEKQILSPENQLGLDRKYLKQKQAKTSEVLSNNQQSAAGNNWSPGVSETSQGILGKGPERELKDAVYRMSKRRRLKWGGMRKSHMRELMKEGGRHCHRHRSETLFWGWWPYRRESAR